MFDIGFFEVLVVGVIGLVVLGPEKLPGAIRSTSRTIRNIRNMATGFRNEMEQQLRIQELHENLKKAEAQQLKDLSPELQRSVDELRAAAESVQQPYANKPGFQAGSPVATGAPEQPLPGSTNSAPEGSAERPVQTPLGDMPMPATSADKPAEHKVTPQPENLEKNNERT